MAFNRTSASFQVVVIGFIAFCCPGIFNAMSGLGGAGQDKPDAANAANVALYSCFAIFGYFGGVVYNMIGNKLCMCLGGFTYVFYAISMYIVGNVDGSDWLAPVAGGLLGVGAGIFWAAQGGMMLAYSTEASKGKNISIFWIIFNLGGFIGGLIAFGINYNTVGGTANPALYFTFAALMAVGAVSALFLLASPDKVTREDGSSVASPEPVSPIDDIKGALSVIVKPEILLLLFTFLASNWYYTYQLNYMNGALFDVPSRGLNSALYWGTQMFSSWVTGKVLDKSSKNAGTRGKWAWVVTYVSLAVWFVSAMIIQYTFEGGHDKVGRLGVVNLETYEKANISFKESGRASGIIISFLIAAFGDAALQTFAYWLIGSMANGDVMLAARYSGSYKGIQSLGAAIAWGLDLSISYAAQLWIAFALFLLSAIGAWVAITRISKNLAAVGDKDEDRMLKTDMVAEAEM